MGKYRQVLYNFVVVSLQQACLKVVRSPTAGLYLPGKTIRS